MRIALECLAGQAESKVVVALCESHFAQDPVGCVILGMEFDFLEAFLGSVVILPLSPENKAGDDMCEP